MAHAPPTLHPTATNTGATGRARRPGARAVGQVDHRPGSVVQRHLQDLVHQHAQDLGRAMAQAVATAAPGGSHGRSSGLPDGLRQGIEALSGLPMDDVRVHHDDPRPARLGAAACAQGRDIHLGPGQGQHLPHEAWHVVQQAQGRVRPTAPFSGGTAVNDDAALEREADVMGRRALQATGGPAATVLAHRADLPPPPAAVVQWQRLPLANPPLPITVAALAEAVQRHLVELDQVIDGSADDVKNGFLAPKALLDATDQKQSLNQTLEELKALALGEQAFERADIENGTTDAAKAFRAVLQPLGAVRRALNKSLAGYTKWLLDKGAPDPNAYQPEDHSDKKQRKAEEEAQAHERDLALRKAKRQPGLGQRWTGYRDRLAYADGKPKVFNQFVPADAGSIERCVRSGNILDAVFHQDKAFWVSNLKKYKLDNTVGKVKMAYHFSEAGARSLVEDHLLCASGDFAEDNDEPYTGETGHPWHTLWKPNEVGAYGVGARRLAELAGEVVRIEAFSAEGKPIVFK